LWNSLPLSIILWARTRYIDLFFFLKEDRLVFSYHQIQEHPKLLLAMTGLTRPEFLQLLPHFQYAWEQYVQQHYVDRDDRQRQYGGGRSEATLVPLEAKLLFILYYVKVYPLQEILAFEFGMVQSTANEWIHILSEVLQKALDHGGYVPERDPKQLGTVLASEAESTYGIDGTERPRQCPLNAEKPKHYDSGKKKLTRSSISFLAASIRAQSII
jgi:Helix-turn-helix of DDE superfamily endonuclease